MCSSKLRVRERKTESKSEWGEGGWIKSGATRRERKTPFGAEMGKGWTQWLLGARDTFDPVTRFGAAACVRGTCSRHEEILLDWRKCKCHGSALPHTHTHKQTHTHARVYNLLSCQQKVFTAVDGVLTDVGGGGDNDSDDVSELLATVENAVALIGPQLRDKRTRLETRQTGKTSDRPATEQQMLVLPSGWPSDDAAVPLWSSRQ